MTVETKPWATPDPRFAIPPYSPQPSGGNNDWWYVANKNGYNCLTFANRPGAKFIDESAARQLADSWNDLGTPPDWRDVGWYHSTEACCVCGSRDKIGIEPRFSYAVCKTHSKLSPTEVSQQRNHA